MGCCFHCGEAVPKNENRTISINGQTHPLCCAGCEAVSKLIIDSGLSNFYQFRSKTAHRPAIKETSEQWAAYDEPSILEQICIKQPKPESNTFFEAIFILENLYCGACAWLIKNTLSQYPGVTLAEVNPGTHRMRLRWQQDQTPLSHLLETIAKLGYQPHPSSEADTHYLKQKRSSLKRLVVAGVGMMQVMMNAIAIYLDSQALMDPSIKQLLILISLLITTPVVFYAAAPFFLGAWRDISHRRTGMDVPVALAISSAFFASVWSTFTGHGEIYFDSVCMFVFFLSLGRFAEMIVRHKLLYSHDAFSVLLPSTVCKIIKQAKNKTQHIPLNQLQTGDLILVKAGEVIPCDGTLVTSDDTQSINIDESILTGESLPVKKRSGEQLFAGSINLNDTAHIRVTQTGKQTTLAHIKNLLDIARTEKPKLAQLADQIAGKFVFGVLLISVVVATYWYLNDPKAAFPIVLAVLVVTCPCAFSLATPTALVAASIRMGNAGLLLTQTNAIEQLNNVNHIVFDKTGTLTKGKVQLKEAFALQDHTDSAKCIEIATALEQQTKHPIASAFTNYSTPHTANAVKTVPGCGIEGMINQEHYFLGSQNYIEQVVSAVPKTDQANQHSIDIEFFLANEEEVLAQFICGDQIREDAVEVVEQLKNLNFQLSILSGDQQKPVQNIAIQLGIAHFYSQLSPKDKLQHLQALQKQGAVAMLGDGINDAPVLASADTSIAMNKGSSLAQSQADIILLNDQLKSLLDALVIARKTKNIIRQNILWAISYNIIAVPLAASGIIAPWMAAIGMSLSSLLVVLNATRIKYTQINKNTGVTTKHTPTQSLEKNEIAL